MNTVSLWKKLTRSRPQYPSLDKIIEADVVIIGGGITGVTAALELSLAGKKTVLLEKQSISGGTTGYSTGNLYIATQPLYQTIESKFDLETARTIADSRKQAIDYIEDRVKEFNIDCGFMRRQWYIYSSDKGDGSEDNSEIIRDEIDVLHQCGIDIEIVTKLPLPVPFRLAACMQNQARLNPMQYVAELSEAAARAGCLIFENSPVTDFELSGDDCCMVTTEGGKIKAEYSVMATHTPLGINVLQSLAAPYRSYVVAAKLKSGTPNGNFWDVESPHHAISSHPSSPGSTDLDLLMVAGSHHKTGQPENIDENSPKTFEEETDHYKALEEYLHKYHDVDHITHRWSAQHYKPADSVPYIGKSPFHSEKSFVATGFFADGLVYGTVAGMLLPDLVNKKENSWTEVYDPTRFTPFKSAKEFIKENVNETLQYLKDLPGISDVSEFSEVKEGEGKIMEIGGEKYGVYRDTDGQVHVVSAVCTHMACIVEWNDAEKTWDCPCHGSRFTHNGNYIEGPALSDLPKKY